jgi:hypothetical protein
MHGRQVNSVFDGQTVNGDGLEQYICHRASGIIVKRVNIFIPVLVRYFAFKIKKIAIIFLQSPAF